MTAFKRLCAVMFCALFAFAAACGGDKDGGGEAAHEDDHSHDGKHGGQVVESSDHSAHFEIVHDEATGAVMLYVYDGSMKPAEISEAPVLNLMVGGNPVAVQGSGKAPTSEWAFVDDALKGEPKGRFRVKMNGKTFTPEFGGEHEDDHGHEHEDGEDDHGHEHDGDHEHGPAHGPHDGTIAKFDGGHVELKLHDDKGDLELWIAKDAGITQPFDLSCDATIAVTFTDKGGKEVTLKVRNKDKNEDEDGKPNIRDGKTNYFIFPGDTGADATWLMGTEFESQVTVTFEDDGMRRATKPFLLRPHTHGEGEGHDHK